MENNLIYVNNQIKLKILFIIFFRNLFSIFPGCFWSALMSSNKLLVLITGLEIPTFDGGGVPHLLNIFRVFRIEQYSNLTDSDLIVRCISVVFKMFF